MASSLLSCITLTGQYNGALFFCTTSLNWWKSPLMITFMPPHSRLDVSVGLLCCQIKPRIVDIHASNVCETIKYSSMIRYSFLDQICASCQILLVLGIPAMGCVTCHTCHGCVTDFRPILGNPMEVTHVTSLGHVYLFPH